MKVDTVRQFSADRPRRIAGPRAPDSWNPGSVGDCFGLDPELWFPTPSQDATEAKSVCARCPLRQECLRIGVDRKEWGIWGGVLLQSGKQIMGTAAA